MNYVDQSLATTTKKPVLRNPLGVEMKWNRTQVSFLIQLQEDGFVIRGKCRNYF